MKNLRVHGVKLAAGASVCLWTLAGLAHGGDLTIRDVAPRHATFVVGVDNVASMMEAVDRTGLRALWEDDATLEWLKNATEGSLPQFMEALEEFGLTKDDFRAPTGAWGLAAWPDVDDEAEMITLMLADYGELAKDVNDTFVEALERAAGKDVLELSEGEYEGVTVWTIVMPEAKEDEDEFGAFPDPSEFTNWLDRMAGGRSFFAHSGDYLLLASTEEALHNTIDRVKGMRAPSIDESADFAAVRRQLGGSSAYAVFLVSPAIDAARKALAADPDSTTSLAQALPMLDALGLTEVKAVAAGARFDTEASMAETPIAVLAPKKRGLLSLFDLQGPFEAPQFIGPDVATVTLLRFNFAGVLPLVNEVLASLPEEQAMEMQGVVGMISMTAGPLLANIGPEMYVVSSYERPFAHDSQRQVFALTVKDAAAVAQSLAGIQPMTGLEARDFQGNQIWSGGPNMPHLPAIGLGFGRLFIGPPPAVENAMRQAGAADGPALAKEERFRASTRALQPGGMLYAWSNIAETVAWYEWSSKNVEAMVKAQIAAAFGDAETEEERQWQREAEADAVANIPAWMKNPLPAELLKRHLGDSVMELRPTNEGFEGRMLWLRPQ